MAIGPDGSFIFGGPIHEHDRGGLNAAFSVSVVEGHRLGMMDFGTELAWVAGGPDDMAIFATVIREKCIAAFGRLPYDKSTLPIKVVANHEKHIVELYLPRKLVILAANAEMWLALAEVIETKLAELEVS